MTTALDTNVLLDLFMAGAIHHEQSRDAIWNASWRGELIVSTIVYAEIVPHFGERALLDAALNELDVRLSPVSTDIAWEAGLRWMRYRQAGGPRTRILADFLIGAHALLSADVFLTRDRGFYDTYFPDLSQAPFGS